ncbi:hypothetical protein [Nocardia huaxiensis]|uniref:hypothetical protein n=1 Tax=Nocardia huaxiensis TaxID=2755382 RepID=UPI001E3DC5ED|nr:hypothetical protein [Nocardia huaxiensis]UFS98181.1 hypothetical protein LPY97_09940 [Nocardia huaxiensis]
MAELAAVWREWSDRLDELRPSITAEVDEWPTGFDNFDQCAMLLQEWGEIVEEADRRGWGLLYLAQ